MARRDQSWSSSWARRRTILRRGGCAGVGARGAVPVDEFAAAGAHLDAGGHQREGAMEVRGHESHDRGCA